MALFEQVLFYDIRRHCAEVMFRCSLLFGKWDLSVKEEKDH
jgi:hypothetical protein